MVIGTALGWGNWPTVALSVMLAFTFGYLMTLLPLVQTGMELGAALTLAFASDTLSITVMEIVDSVVMVVIPGAMDAGLTDSLFWVSLIVSLVLAGIAAFPANRWLIAKGRGHALVHEDRKSTRLNSSHGYISYAVFCLKKKKNNEVHHVKKTPINDDRVLL